MQYRTFFGQEISRLGFGLMRLPVIDGDQSKVDYAKVEEMVLYAVEHGVNYFDTAFPYHNGYSEITFGEIMKKNNLRDKVLVATKLFTLGMDSPDYNPKKMFETQLERLQTDHIDFYLMHGLHGDQWDTLVNKFDIKNYLKEQKAAGRIRHIGFSFHDSYEKFVEILNDFDEWELAQIQYNYLDNEIQAGDAGVAFALEKGIPLTVMEPVKGGNLIFPNYPAIEEIKAKHGLADMSNAELAFDYVYDNPGFMTVLSGMSTLEQVKDNIAIADKSSIGMMTPEMKACTEEIKAFIAGIENIPCTGCRYCTPGCPMKIQIPAAFNFYNTGKKFNNPDAQKRGYERECGNLADCVECGQCVKACPQHLNIPELLKEVRAYLE